MHGLPHPALVLRRLGVRDRHVGTAIGILLFFQVIVALIIFKNYQELDTGFAVRGVLAPGLIPSPFVLAVVVAVWLLLRALRTDARSRRSVKPASNVSFNDLRMELEHVRLKSIVTVPIELLYHPRQSDASFATERDKQPAIVLGPGFRELQRKCPLLVRAVIGHEISHIELNETRRETWLRRALSVYCILTAGLFASVWMMMVFLQPSEIGGRLIAGIEPLIPKPSPDVLGRFGGHTIVMLLDVVAVIVFGFFFVARRELMHDFRASQLANSTALAKEFFAPRCYTVIQRGILFRFLAKGRAFIGLHPSDCERAARIERRDFIALNAGLFPAIGGMLFPSLLLLTAPAQDIFGLSKGLANILALFVVAVLTFLVLRADSVRFGVSMVINRFSFRCFFQYCAVLGSFSILTGVLLSFWYFYRDGHAFEVLLSNCVGLLVGGVRLFVLYSLALAVLSYLVAVRICALGDAKARPFALFFEQGIAAFVVLLGQTAISYAKMPRLAFVAAGLSLAVGMFGAIVFFLFARCEHCKKLRWAVLRLSSRCNGCMYEHASELAAITSVPPRS